MSGDKRGGRPLEALRKVEMTPGFHRLAEGSVLYRAEGTVVLVTASVDSAVPEFLKGKGRGWVTAEYQMHPRANPRRRENRDGRDRTLSGRAREIQRLIGRALRAAVDLRQLGERTIAVDCDVLEADGGTRCASITGGWVALRLAVNKLLSSGVIKSDPLTDHVAAVSCGIYGGQPVLDLDYAEDSVAGTDANFVMTGGLGLIEVQGSAEGATFTRAQLDQLMDLAEKGVGALVEAQRAATA